MRYYFRPLSGNLLSLPATYSNALNIMRMFSSPIGESTFSTATTLVLYVFNFLHVFVPYRGIYFLYDTRVISCWELFDRFRPLSGNLLSLPLPLEPLCLSGFRSCFAGQNLKIVFLFLFLMLAPLFPLFYAVRRKILFTAGKTLFFPFPYHIIFLDISCICIHAVQLQGLRPLHVYAVHTL